MFDLKNNKTSKTSWVQFWVPGLQGMQACHWGYHRLRSEISASLCKNSPEGHWPSSKKTKQHRTKPGNNLCRFPQMLWQICKISNVLFEKSKGSKSPQNSESVREYFEHIFFKIKRRCFQNTLHVRVPRIQYQQMVKDIYKGQEQCYHQGIGDVQRG